MNQSDLAISYLFVGRFILFLFPVWREQVGVTWSSPLQPAELTRGRLELHGFSPHLQSAKVHTNPEEFNPGFVAHLIPKVERVAHLEVADTLHLVELSIEAICSVSVMRNFRGRYTTNYKYISGKSATSRAWTSLPHQQWDSQHAC